MRLNLGLAMVLGLPAAVACRHGDDADKSVIIQSGIKAAPPRALGPGDIRISATDNDVDLAMIGDTITSGLSEAALAKAQKSTDTTAVKGTGFSASIEKMVKSTVQGALGTRVGFALSDIRSARYENGRIVFDWVDPKKNIFEHSNVNGRNVLESFSAADAQRFVDAVNARRKAAATT